MRTTLLIPLAVAALALVAWAPALIGGFSFDDREIVFDNPAVNGAVDVGEVFRRDYWHHRGSSGQYRPLASLSLGLDHRIWDQLGPGYHATGLLLHALAAALLAWTLLRLGARAEGVFLGAAVFAVHPALSDAVAWISGRTSTLAGACGMAALLCATFAGERESAGAARRRPWRLVATCACAALLVGAALTKEDGLVFAPLAVAVAASSRARVRIGLAAAAALMVYFGLRLQAGFPLVPRSLGAPLEHASLAERALFGGRGLLESLRLLLLPVAHPPNYRAVAGFRPGDAHGIWVVLGWIPWCALLFLGLRWLRVDSSSRRRTAVFCVGSALALVPVLAIFPAGEVFAPRYLYLPLALLALPLGSVLARLPWALALVLVALALPVSWLRAPVYFSRESYARAVLEHVPDDVGAWNDLGLAREEAGDLGGAAEAWTRAVGLDPEHSRLWSNLGRHQLASGDEEQARTSLERAVRCGPNNPVAHCNLGKLELDAGNTERAARLYREATLIAPGMGPAWRGLGNALVRRGESRLARQALVEALRLDPTDVGARLLLERVTED